jgi:uncharacterized membrane protein
MDNSANHWTDQRLETIIGNLLRGGVMLAAAVVAIGGMIFLVRYGHDLPHYRAFTGEPEDLRRMPGILRGAASFHGRYIIQLGLLLLIATPVARVAFSIVAFTLQHDRLYVGITLIVLGVLIFSLAGGHL